MTADVGRIELKLSSDPRLVAGVGGAIGHVAERVGCDPGAQANLVAAAEEACRDTFPLLGSAGAQLGVTIEDFPDRVEVTLEYRGPPGPAPESSAALEADAPAGRSGHKLLAHVDRLRCGTQGGVSHMTLVKYIRPPSQGQ